MRHESSGLASVLTIRVFCARLERLSYQSARSLEELAALVAVVESNGFTAAARASGARKATLSLHVARLEKRIGVPLLFRTTRSIRLTEEGHAYFGHAQRAISAARDAEAQVISAKARPSGLLRVTAPTALADGLLESVVMPYLMKHSDVTVHLDTSARQIDFAREPFDLAIRLGPLADSSLVARRLGTSGGGYFASPRYLKRRGTPRRPGDLSTHETIAIPGRQGPISWTFVVKKEIRSFVIRPRLLVSTFELGARAAAAGLGILRAPSEPLQPFLAKQQLVRILAEWSQPDAEVFAVIPPGGASVPKTRVFLDMLVEWFAERHQGHSDL
jgi:LysR family transcriptional regulator for bpeEF and oprC